MKYIKPYLASLVWIFFQQMIFSQNQLFNICNSLPKPKGTVTYIINTKDITDSTALINADIYLGTQHAITDSTGKATILINTTETINEDNTTPESFYIKNNYPNPFNKETNIKFGIKQPDDITIRIYTTNGEEILKENYPLIAGHYNFKINELKNVANQPLIIAFNGKNVNMQKKIMKLGHNKTNYTNIKLEKITGNDEDFTPKTIQKNTGTLEIIIQKNHYNTYTEQINNATTDTTITKYINPKMKNIILRIENADTDTTDMPAYTIINEKTIQAPNGTINTHIKEADEYTITAGLYKKDATTKNSFKRTIRKNNNEEINDTIRVVDFYFRNMKNEIVDSMYIQGISPTTDSTKMNPERYKEILDYLHFHNMMNGRPAPGFYFPHIINGYAPEDRLPEKIVIAKKAYYSDTQTTHQFNQETIDAIIKDIDEWIRPLLGQTNMPVIIQDSMDVGTEAATGTNYVVIIPNGSMAVYGLAGLVGTSSIPATIIFGSITLNSNYPFSQPDIPSVHAARLQELYTVILGLNGSVTDDVLKQGESVLNDNVNITNPTFPQPIDYKIIRTVMDKTYKRGTYIDDILSD